MTRTEETAMTTNEILAHNMRTLREVDTDKMERAFALVTPPTHWKDAIAAFVSVEQADAANVDPADIAEAVSFYTSTIAKIRPIVVGKRHLGWTVEAAGYRAGPAGDY